MPCTTARPTDACVTAAGFLHQDGIKPIKFVSATCEACDTRRHPNEGSWWRLQRLRTTFHSGKDTAPTLLRVPNANKVLIDVWREQTEQRGVLATQDDHATLFRALGSIRLDAATEPRRLRKKSYCSPGPLGMGSAPSCPAMVTLDSSGRQGCASIQGEPVRLQSAQGSMWVQDREGLRTATV
jgi:hypothetical protein